MLEPTDPCVHTRKKIIWKLQSSFATQFRCPVPRFMHAYPSAHSDIWGTEPWSPSLGPKINQLRVRTSRFENLRLSIFVGAQTQFTKRLWNLSNSAPLMYVFTVVQLLFRYVPPSAIGITWLSISQIRLYDNIRWWVTEGIYCVCHIRFRSNTIKYRSRRVGAPIYFTALHLGRSPIKLVLKSSATSSSTQRPTVISGSQSK